MPSILLSSNSVPAEVMEFKGTYNADTNTPPITDATGSHGNYYKVTGSTDRDLGSGTIDFQGSGVLIHDSVKFVYYAEDTGATGEVNTGTNIGAGSGIFDSKNGLTLEFNSLTSGTTALVVAAPSGGEIEFTIADAVATVSSGLLSADDKDKLDKIDAVANNYVHPNHTGDVASAGDGATTIQNGAVSNPKMAQMSEATIKGRQDATGTGYPEDLTPTQARLILNVEDGANAYTHPNHTGDVTSTGDGATTIADGAVSYAKIQDVLGSRVLGRGDGGTGDAQELLLGTGIDVVGTTINVVASEINTSALNNDAGWNAYSHPNHTGDVTSSGDGVTTIQPLAVETGMLEDGAVSADKLADGAGTNVKLADAAAWTIKMRNAGTSGDLSDAASGDLTEEASPAAGDFVVGYLADGSIRKYDVGNLPVAGGGEVNTASNQGTAGVGVYDTKAGVDLQFRNISANSNKMVVSLDGVNKEIQLDVDPANISTSTLNNDAGWTAYTHPNHTGDVTSLGDGATTIVDNAVTTSKINALAVTSAKMAIDAVYEDSIQTAAVSADKLAVDSVITSKIQNNAVTTDKVIANAIDNTKLANVKEYSLKGKRTVTTGDPEDFDETDLTTEFAPETGDWLLGWTAEGVLVKYDIGDLPSSGETNDGANLGTGEDIFLGKSGANLQFAGMLANTNKMSVTSASSNVVFDVVPGNILTSELNNDAGWTAYTPPNHTGDVTSVGDGVTTISNNAVTNPKLADMAQDTLKGRVTAGSGDPEDLTAAQARTILNVADGANNYSHPNHTGDVTSSGDGATTIANNAVTNAKANDMAQDTMKGRVTAGTGDPEDLTATQVRTLLNVADGANAYAHPNHSGDVTSVADGVTTIANNAVSNAKLENMAQDTIKVRYSTGLGDPEDAVIGSLTEETAPGIGDMLIGWESGGGLRKFDVDEVSNPGAYTNGNLGGTPTIDWTNGRQQNGVLNANATVTFTDPARAGWLTLLLAQDVTGGRTVTWPTLKGGDPTVNTAASENTVVLFYFDGTDYHTFG